MQLNFRLLSVVTLAAFTTFTACKKESTVSFNLDGSTEVTTHSDDQSNVSNDMDAVANDVNAAVESSTNFSGRTMNINSICNATAVMDTVSNPRKITITYAGVNCYGTHSRTGVVVLSMPAGMRWKDAGATLTVTVQNLKITRVSDNKSITINGTETFTNVSGGLLLNLPNLQSITHTITSSGLSITFDDNSVRSWQVARKRVFTWNNGAVVITITGTHSDGTNNNIAEWGSNRFGHAFTTSITEPLIIRSDCNFRLTGGAIKHEGFATATATFGLNAQGNPTSCPGTGSYYLKLTWTGIGGQTHTAILPY
jgi:hypothetical protein